MHEQPHVPLLFDGEGGPSDMVTTAKNLGFFKLLTLRADSPSLEGVNFRQLHEKLFVDLKVDGAFTDFSDKTRDLIRVGDLNTVPQDAARVHRRTKSSPQLDLVVMGRT